MFGGHPISDEKTDSPSDTVQIETMDDVSFRVSVLLLKNSTYFQDLLDIAPPSPGTSIHVDTTAKVFQILVHFMKHRKWYEAIDYPDGLQGEQYALLLF